MVMGVMNCQHRNLHQGYVPFSASGHFCCWIGFSSDWILGSLLLLLLLLLLAATAAFHHALRSQFGSVIDGQPGSETFDITIYPRKQPTPLPRRKTVQKLTLHKTPQHLTPRLQQRMTDHNRQKPLQPLPAMLNHVIAETVREHLAGQGGDGDTRTLPLQDLAEIFKVGVAPAHDGVAQLEGRDAGVQVDLVGGVHGAGRGAVGLGVFDL